MFYLYEKVFTKKIKQLYSSSRITISKTTFHQKGIVLVYRVWIDKKSLQVTCFYVRNTHKLRMSTEIQDERYNSSFYQYLDTLTLNFHTYSYGKFIIFIILWYRYIYISKRSQSIKVLRKEKNCKFYEMNLKESLFKEVYDSIIFLVSKGFWKCNWNFVHWLRSLRFVNQTFLWNITSPHPLRSIL